MGASFKEELSNLAPSAIVADSGIAEDSICILTHDFAGNPNFEFRGKSLYYMGTSSLSVKISAVCARAGVLQGIINDELKDPAIVAPGAAGSIFCGDRCDATNSPNETCCAVMLNFRR